MPAVRSLAVVIGSAALALLASACSRAPKGAVVGTGLMSRQAVALKTVVAERSTRFVARRQLCVLSIEVRDVNDCERLRQRQHSDSDYAALRGAVPVDSGEVNYVACAIVSAEIPLGDSVLVAVGIIGPEVEGLLAGSSTKWVWFRDQKGKDSVWVVPPPNDAVSDVAPVRTQQQCG